MSSGRFEKDMQTWGDFLHAGFSKCPVADLTKSANWGMGNFCKHTSANVQWQIGENLQIGGEFLQAHISKCPVADLRKSANWGGFLQAHISKCPVADLRKSANGGRNFCMQILVNLFLSFTFNIDLLSDKKLLIIILPSFPAVKVFQILKIIPLKNNRSCFCKRFT